MIRRSAFSARAIFVRVNVKMARGWPEEEKIAGRKAFATRRLQHPIEGQCPDVLLNPADL
jgi:hypothetical protein